jgi:hypothetical protein
MGSTMTDLIHFSEHRLQEVSLLIMGFVYAFRVRWLLRFRPSGDRQPATGPPGTTETKGICYSLMNIAMPWAMESTRRNPFFYAQFVMFHLGVAASIGLSFIIPYAPDLLNLPGLVLIFQIVIGTAFVVALFRLYRRISNRMMRAISSPDDYFSLALLTVWFAFAVLSVPNRPEQDGTLLVIFFMLTAFFLIYVPFSKISHYLYYPFTRFYLGRTLGHRGVYPLRRGPMPSSADMKWSLSASWQPLTVDGSSAKDAGRN